VLSGRRFRESVSVTIAAEALVFFFSSRRRHTRSDRDWSSDVCSSDLLRLHCYGARNAADSRHRGGGSSLSRALLPPANFQPCSEIGRASCRERVEISAVVEP